MDLIEAIQNNPTNSIRETLAKLREAEEAYEREPSEENMARLANASIVATMVVGS